MFENIYHVQLSVSNISGAVDWYTRTLGFSLATAPTERHAFLKLPDGPFLMLWKTDDSARANFRVDGEVFPAILYRTSRIHDLHTRLQKIGARITTYQDDGHCWVLKFYDPDGNMLGALQDNSPA